ncbi:MAG: hypothetical protein ACFCU8_09015 [Thermosynechococcaceae cyanobacterium]
MPDVTICGQMLWKLVGDDRALYLRHSELEPWQYYEEFPQYFLPDPEGFSKGIATFMALLKKDWVVTNS